jgi:hypothetical protein
VSSGGEYVVAAYGVVLFALLMYVVVIGMKSARQARETELLARLIESREDADGGGVEASLESAER